jgi:hypothetical protein
VLTLSLLLFLGPGVIGFILETTTGPRPTPRPQPTSTSSGAPATPIPAPTGLPPLPDPSTREQQRAYVFDNTLYAQMLTGPIDCPIGIDLPHATVRELEAYLNTFVGCLMEAWTAPVVAAGFELPRPRVTVYSEQITTKCGKSQTENAFYCGADQQMYLASDLIALFPRLQDARFMVESIIAHEFGHAIQARTGILLSEYRYEDEAATTAEADQWSRRTELQADCFAGLGLRAVGTTAGLSEADVDNVTQLFTLLGDSQVGGDHGQSASRVRWINAGIDSNTPGQCRTFSAPSNEVE